MMYGVQTTWSYVPPPAEFPLYTFQLSYEIKICDLLSSASELLLLEHLLYQLLEEF